MDIRRKKKRTLKRCAVVVVCLLLLLALAALVLGLVRSCMKNKPIDLPKQSINYYEPDFSADIFIDADYLAKERRIYYTSGSVRLVLDEYDTAELTEGQRFFVKYFEEITHGNADAYHTFFAAEYDENTAFENHPYSRIFPMQRVYDIHVTELGRTSVGDTSYTYHDKPCVYGVYKVEYRILKNDGEFRADLPDGALRPLVFELVSTDVGTSSEQTWIRDMYAYDEIAAE